MATVIEHPDPAWLGRRLIVRPGRSRPQHRLLGATRLDDAVADDALRAARARAATRTLTYGPDGERRGEGMRVFVWAFAPPPRMLVFGAIDFAAAVARVGAFLGYHVTVCDARPVFATTSRFPEADEVVVEWPHRYLDAEAEAGRIDERTVICVLTHDPKFDVPLLEVALRLPEVALHRGDGLAAHPRRPARRGCARPASPRRRSARLSRRSGSTSAPARRRRPRSASPPRSSPRSGAASGQRLAGTDGPIHHADDIRRTARPALDRPGAASRSCGEPPAGAAHRDRGRDADPARGVLGRAGGRARCRAGDGDQQRAAGADGQPDRLRDPGPGGRRPAAGPPTRPPCRR